MKANTQFSDTEEVNRMILDKEDLAFASKLMSDFKKTLPRKKRKNIDRALRKASRLEPLNSLEKEAYSDFKKFINTYDFDLIQ